MPSKPSPAPVGTHGAESLPLVTVESYNLEIEDADGFIGDRASKGAFLDLVEELREAFRQTGEDPLGDTPTPEIGRKALDRLLMEGDPEASGLVIGAIEEFAQRLAAIIRRFMRQKAWREVERIVVGGGFRQSRIGEIVIGRAAGILKKEGVAVQLVPIRYHPDEAGLIGCVHLAPSWVFSGHDSIVAVDIGGSNIRCGIVELGLRKGKDFSSARVFKSALWRHADDKPDRDAAIARLATMIKSLITMARAKKLAPFIGIGVPGVIEPDGIIDRGAQNLPGNWASSRFHLPDALCERIPQIRRHDTVVLMHNDAVVQGLSEAPFMRDVKKWGALTIGTGLGNASYANRSD